MDCTHSGPGDKTLSLCISLNGVVPQPVAAPVTNVAGPGAAVTAEDEAWRMAQAQLRANIAGRQRV